MGAHIVLSLLNELRKRDKMRGRSTSVRFYLSHDIKINSNTPRLYSQRLYSVMYWLINHCTDWAQTPFRRHFEFNDVIYLKRHCNVDNRLCNVVFTTT